MLLLKEWRNAIDRIAEANDGGVCRAVDAERQRIEDERQGTERGELLGRPTAAFQPVLANTIRQRHAASDIAKLRDCVVYLIWGKLTKAWEHDLPDAFLGITDLEAYLSALVPGRYQAAQVSEFVRSLGPPTPLGDLRSFLCARPAVNRQLYSHDQLDLFLLAEQIEAIRFQPPPTVGAGLSGKELKNEIKRFQRRPNRDLRDMLFENGWRGIPLSILGWAAMITDQLVTGSCDCPQAFSQTPKAYSSAHRRCRDYHFLAQDSLRRAARCEPDCRLYQQKKATSDPLEYVEQAVIEKMLQKHHKNFAKTMLCNVFVTPRGNTLRLGSYWNGSQWTEGLTETGRDIRWDSSEWIDRRQEDDAGPHDAGQQIRCFGCPECLSFIGDKDSYQECVQQQHYWCSGTIAREDPQQPEPLTDGRNVLVSILCCPSKHFWPADGSATCPLCGQPAVCKPQRIEVFCPANRTYEDVEDWRETLGG